MIRLISIIIGLGFTLVVLIAFGTGLATVISDGELKPETAEHVFHEHAHAPDEGFSFTGPFGKFDKQQLQRGLQVYSEVCAACHSLKYVSFRDIAALGYSEGQVKAFAASKQVPGIDPNTGEATTRPGLPTDRFPSPYPNAVAAAAANNNAIPPDLSLITKARHNGSEYVYSLLTGYQAAGTRGRSLQDGAESIRIHGQNVHVEAKVRTVNGLSSHADMDEIMRWLGSCRQKPRRVFVVHGEQESSEHLAGLIRQATGAEVSIPQLQESFTI